MSCLQIHDLQDAICLLALATEHPQTIDRLKLKPRNLHVEINASSDAAPESLTADATVKIEKEKDEGISEVFDDANASSSQQDLASLRNKVLDRLAEILARVKTNRAGRSRTILDPKHVSATFMIIRNQFTTVDIYCSKNEGLDQQIPGQPKGRKDDTDFLNTWKTHMQDISNKGSPAAVFFRSSHD